ncbi:ORF80 [white sturgeon herpesvirus 2]|uniref:ORF81 n=1 Tax=white sturgeon herpesvirus 2 TaxID=320884 RepID=F6GQ70_9VIRU|nr:ORF80 [Acipenserid herpesvirus 2]AEF97690.1 ORF80 [Acipenserid herpesvirus 2]
MAFSVERLVSLLALRQSGDYEQISELIVGEEHRLITHCVMPLKEKVVSTLERHFVGCDVAAFLRLAHTCQLSAATDQVIKPTAQCLITGQMGDAIVKYIVTEDVLLKDVETEKLFTEINVQQLQMKLTWNNLKKKRSALNTTKQITPSEIYLEKTIIVPLLVSYHTFINTLVTLDIECLLTMFQ